MVLVNDEIHTNTLYSRCIQIGNVVQTILAFVIASAFIHWALAFVYSNFCIGNTLWDFILSPLSTGSLGCQLVFRGMRMTHYEYMTHIMKLFTVL
jgi:hypothetical protein